MPCQNTRLCNAAEHEARLRAEAAAQDRGQRLAVHAQQVAEYAEQKMQMQADLAAQVRVVKRRHARACIA